jgi:hypothetical protein
MDGAKIDFLTGKREQNHSVHVGIRRQAPIVGRALPIVAVHGGIGPLSGRW